MKHHASLDFWELYEKLPATVRELADKNFELLKSNPRHPSIRLKKISPYWSARIGRNYRALAIEIPEGLLWFWIGDHGNYDEIISKK